MSSLHGDGFRFVGCPSRTSNLVAARVGPRDPVERGVGSFVWHGLAWSFRADMIKDSRSFSSIRTTDPSLNAGNTPVDVHLDTVDIET
jgi:hypothetical protein